MYFCLNRATAGGGLPLEQFVKLSADAGFPGADVDVSYGVANGAAALRDLYASHKLRFGGWALGDWRSDEAKHADMLAWLRKQAAIAAPLGIDSCCTWIMPSSKLPFLDNWNFHVQRLKPAAQVLADHGLRLGLEFIGPHHLRRANPHEFIHSPGLMLELGAAIGPNVGLLVDVFHCHTANVTWEHLASVPKEKIVLAHFNDAPRIPVAEVHDQKRLLPGEGGIDLRAFLDAVGRTGYAGPVSVEVFSEDLKRLSPAEAAGRAWAATRAFA